jgi:hypothetical protein
VNCPHCAQSLFRSSSDRRKLKVRTSILVLHKGGGAEINCPACKQGVILPLVLTDKPLRKADEPRLIVRRRK